MYKHYKLNELTNSHGPDAAWQLIDMVAKLLLLHGLDI